MTQPFQNGKRADGQAESKGTEAAPRAGTDAGELWHELPPDLWNPSPACVGTGKSAGRAEIELCAFNQRSLRPV